ncbi:uncharacterized protein BCR38DRAFT_219856 [Pseudomassariella vexata]|uniref:Uncharacterized protein n=1 Tax=Pseudomassariella vexata TaxID=1141098 RepID=A0A1Y2DV21_9PEZI|nr:uncharacterized protein BCR38DRAFT_219856 [Pseudomassariella vexata]ORY63039.1 hypothetical protein BCR38DRAFT_219856 [Pseudomassariella vexata]
MQPNPIVYTVNGTNGFNGVSGKAAANGGNAEEPPGGEDSDDDGDEAAAPGAEEGATKKKNKNKKRKPKKKRKGPSAQTDPPSVLISQLFPKGEEVEYVNENRYRTTIEEKRHFDNLSTEWLSDYRQAAETHRQVRQWAQKNIKPGQTLTEIANGIEDSVRRLVGHDGLTEGDTIKAGMGFLLNDLLHAFRESELFVVDKTDVEAPREPCHAPSVLCSFTARLLPTGYDRRVSICEEVTLSSFKVFVIQTAHAAV